MISYMWGVALASVSHAGDRWGARRHASTARLDRAWRVRRRRLPRYDADAAVSLVTPSSPAPRCLPHAAQLGIKSSSVINSRCNSAEQAPVLDQEPRAGARPLKPRNRYPPIRHNPAMMVAPECAVGPDNSHYYAFVPRGAGPPRAGPRCDHSLAPEERKNQKRDTYTRSRRMISARTPCVKCAANPVPGFQGRLSREGRARELG